jgi:prepilin-type N-terminal cleavage/methylation domain-containing protein
MQVLPVDKTTHRAFTLVEVMVSASVISMLVLMFASLTSSASRAWISGSGNAERRRNDRALTDYIGQELKGAMLPVQTVNTTTNAGNLQFLINPTSGQVPGAYANADSIFWQAPLATETSYGDIAEVGYFVKWDNSDPTKLHPVLCRFFVNPSAKDTSGNVGQNPEYLIYDPSPNRWLSGSLLDSVAPATKVSGYKGVFGENVVGLWVRSYGVDGQELPRNFDSRTGYTCQLGATDSSGFRQSWTEKRYLPSRVQISIAQVDSHYASRLPAAANQLQQLTNSTSIRDATDFLQVFRTSAAASPALRPLLPGLRIYSTEVQLSNAQ